MLALLLSWGYTYLVSTFSASAPSEHSDGDDWEDEFIDDQQEVMNDLGLSFMDWDSDISEDGLSEGSGDAQEQHPPNFWASCFEGCGCDRMTPQDRLDLLPHHYRSASGSHGYHLSPRVFDPTSPLNINRQPWSLTQLTLRMVRLQFSYFVDRQGFPDYSPDTSDLAPATYHFNSWNRASDILVHEMGYPPQIVRCALPVLDEGYCTVASCGDSSGLTLSAVLN